MWLRVQIVPELYQYCIVIVFLFGRNVMYFWLINFWGECGTIILITGVLVMLASLGRAGFGYGRYWLMRSGLRNPLVLCQRI